MVNEAYEAAGVLETEGISVRLIDIHTIKPIDSGIVIKAARETGAIVTAEEHSVIGGLGDAVAQVVVKNAPCPVAMVGQQDTFGESGKPDDLSTLQESILPLLAILNKSTTRLLSSPFGGFQFSFIFLCNSLI